MEKITMAEVIDYARLDKGFTKREGKSRAKDLQGKMYRFYGKDLLVLYEGDKRVLRGHDKPEVCWICIDCFGCVQSIAARHLRHCDPCSSFCFCDFMREEFLRRREAKQKEWLMLIEL